MFKEPNIWNNDETLIHKQQTSKPLGKEGVEEGKSHTLFQEDKSGSHFGEQFGNAR